MIHMLFLVVSVGQIDTHSGKKFEIRQKQNVENNNLGILN